MSRHVLLPLTAALALFNLAPVDVRGEAWRETLKAKLEHLLPEVDGTKITVTKKTSVTHLADQPTVIGNNLDQLLARSPGVQVSQQPTPTQFNLSYRGLGNPQESEYVLVLQDGIPLASDWIGFPTLYAMPLTQSLSEVELIRGGSSLLYGPEPAQRGLADAPGRSVRRLSPRRPAMVVGRSACDQRRLRRRGPTRLSAMAGRPACHAHALQPRLGDPRPAGARPPPRVRRRLAVRRQAVAGVPGSGQPFGQRCLGAAAAADQHHLAGRTVPQPRRRSAPAPEVGPGQCVHARHHAVPWRRSGAPGDLTVAENGPHDRVPPLCIALRRPGRSASSAS